MSGLLINENLPASLAEVLGKAAPRVIHVGDVGLLGKPDTEIWSYAAAEGLVIATKDSDYVDLAITRGEARVLLFGVGNMRLGALLTFAEDNLDAVRAFLSAEDPFLVLRPSA